MRILMAGSGNYGIGWWRQLIPARAVEQGGYEVVKSAADEDEENPSVESWIRAIGQMFDRFGGGILWCGRMDVRARALARWSDMNGIPFIYDTDDYLQKVDRKNPAHWHTRHPGAVVLRGMHEILQYASCVSVSTPSLARRFNDDPQMPLHAFVCPNHINLEYWGKDAVGMRPLVPRKDRKLRVSMVYTKNRHGDMAPLLLPLRKLAEKGLIQIHIMGVFPEDLAGLVPGYEVVWQRPAKIEEFHYLMYQMQPDVVLSRLEANEFNEDKSNIKWLEATMCGAVLMGTRFGEIERTMPDEGGVKIPATGDKEEIQRWMQEIEDLAREKEKGQDDRRLDMVAKSRRIVETEWTTEAMKDAWTAPVRWIEENELKGTERQA